MSIAPAKNLPVLEALEAVKQNNIAAAERLLQSALAADSKNADALQLMGVVRERQGRPEDAENSYRASLAAAPAQAHVHHNLGLLLARLGRYSEAIAAQREAVRLKRGYLEAMLAMGHAQQDSGDLAGAEKTFRSMLHVQPNLQVARQCLAAVLNLQDQPKAAEAVLRQALAQGSPDRRQMGVLTHDLALTLQKQKRHAEALESLDRTKAILPGMPQIDYKRASALQLLGRLDDAVAAYRQAIARDPGDAFAHHRLNHLLYRLNRDEEFLRSYDDAMQRNPSIASLPLSKGDLLLRAGRDGDAREAFERAVKLAPQDAAAHDGLGQALLALGEIEAALRQHEKALALDPANVSVRGNVLATLLRAGDAERALSVAEDGIAGAPTNQTLLGLWGLALRALGDEREAVLNDYENFVQVFELDPPDGFSGMESFNHELNVCLDRLHTDKRECLDQTLRRGTQTFDNLFDADHDPVNKLRAQIDKAVAAYIARLKADDSHPFLGRKRGGFAYTDSWSSRLHDCGFHTNHVHPRGWLSSAYYVAVPEAVADDKDKQGWIKFGEPHFEMGLKDPIRRAVKPKPGTLVLFPSYTWHGTVPFHDKQARTTIAFDVVPK